MYVCIQMYVPEVLENKRRENGSEVMFENIWVDSIETCILSYVKQIASPWTDAGDRVLGAGALG